MDYLKSARPILAYGPKNIASIEYLDKNNTAFVIDNHDELRLKLQDLIENEKLRNIIVKYDCYHKIDNKLINMTIIIKNLKFAYYHENNGEHLGWFYR